MSIGFTEHDHGSCIAQGVASVEAACAARGLQLTAARRRVLEYLLAEHRALGAYDILDKLRKDGLGSQPPVAYRALDFLVANGFAHRIEHLNAFVACTHPGQAHDPAFLICKECDAVAEAQIEPVKNDLDETARDAGFRLDRAVVEAEGLCPKCQQGDQK